MPLAPVPPSVEQFLAAAHPAVMATIRPDGGPHSVACWYEWRDGRFLLTLDQSRARLRYLRADPRVSLTVLDGSDWYRQVSLFGTVEQSYVDENLVDADRIAQRYTGADYLTRDSERVSVWVRVQRWHGWDSGAGRKITDAGWQDESAYGL
jgi:PPOX class probable F420-dependent enzyme